MNTSTNDACKFSSTAFQQYIFETVSGFKKIKLVDIGLFSEGDGVFCFVSYPSSLLYHPRTYQDGKPDDVILLRFINYPDVIEESQVHISVNKHSPYWSKRMPLPSGSLPKDAPTYKKEPCLSVKPISCREIVKAIYDSETQRIIDIKGNPIDLERLTYQTIGYHLAPCYFF